MRGYIVIAIFLATVITGIYLSNGWIVAIGLLTVCFLPRGRAPKNPATIKPTGQWAQGRKLVKSFVRAENDAVWYVRIVIIIFLAFFSGSYWTTFADSWVFWLSGD
jgi:hypothetical protein